LKHSVPFLALAVSLVMMAGCVKSDSDRDATYRFPLKIGNSWTLLNTIYGYDTQSNAMATTFDTLYVWADSVVTSPENEECIRLKYRYSSYDADEYSYEYVVNREDGLYKLGWYNNLYLPPLKNNRSNPACGLFGLEKKSSAKEEQVWLSEADLLMPYHCAEGTTWHYSENDNYLEHNSEIMPGQNISVPYGAVRCLNRKTTVVIDSTFSWFYHQYFGKPGPVKFTFETEDDLTGEQGEPIGTYPFVQKIELLSCHLE
jgi:hypothetical protein